MSWGERSCRRINMNPCGHDPTPMTCNVDCPGYASNGKPPDSTPGPRARRPIPTYRIERREVRKAKLKAALENPRSTPNPKPPKVWAKGNAQERKKAEKQAKRDAHLERQRDLADPDTFVGDGQATTFIPPELAKEMQGGLELLKKDARENNPVRLLAEDLIEMAHDLDDVYEETIPIQEWIDEPVEDLPGQREMGFEEPE